MALEIRALGVRLRLSARGSGWPGSPVIARRAFPFKREVVVKSEEIVSLALAGHPNSEIELLVGSRPRRIREVIAAAIRAGAPIAPNGKRIASRRAGNGARTGERAEAAVRLLRSRSPALGGFSPRLWARVLGDDARSPGKHCKVGRFLTIGQDRNAPRGRVAEIADIKEFRHSARNRIRVRGDQFKACGAPDL